MHNYVTGLTVYVDGIWTGFGGTVATAQTFKAEAWLNSGGAKVLLDRGWVCYDAKYNRSVIGFAGRYEFFENDTIQIYIQNAGTGTGIWAASYSVDASKEPVSDIGTRFTLHDDVTFMYHARRVNTQTNAGGGALQTNIAMNTGQVGIVRSMLVIGSASAGATLLGIVYDEDANISNQYANAAAGASRVLCLPSIGSAATADNNRSNSQNLVLTGAQYIGWSSSAALQNETEQVNVTIELLNDPTLPVWSTTGSAGTPSLAASSISAANTLIPIIRPRMVGC